MGKLVNQMKNEEQTRQAAIAQRQAAQSKHNNDDWLPEVLEEYGKLLKLGNCHLVASKYGAALETFKQAFSALNWKESSEEGSGGEEFEPEGDERLITELTEREKAAERERRLGVAQRHELHKEQREQPVEHKEAYHAGYQDGRVDGEGG